MELEHSMTVGMPFASSKSCDDLQDLIRLARIQASVVNLIDSYQNQAHIPLLLSLRAVEHILAEGEIRI